jgi:hypothetical protein
LRESNGFRAFKTNQVINAGHEHLSTSHAQQSQDNAFITGKPDRRVKDRQAIGQAVYISRGDLKGYRAKVVYADETSATVEVFAKNN